MKKQHSKYLRACLTSYSMHHVKEEVGIYRAKRKIVEKAIKSKFRDRLAGKIIYGGSIAKKTEINISYDVDLIVPFAHENQRLPKLADEVYRFFKKEFSDQHLIRVRNQRVSVGLFFKTPKGRELRLDIVPGRELKKGEYHPEKYLNLYDCEEKRHFQTNVSLQIKRIRQSHEMARKIIKLLKIWRTAKGHAKLKSFIIEMLVLNAIKTKAALKKQDLAEMLHYVAHRIQQQIKTRRLVDPGNSNNVVSEYLSDHLRNKIGIEMRKICKALKGDHTLLEEFFPLNTLN